MSEDPRDPRDRYVTVCAACLRASCWQGRFYCDTARDAGTRELSVSHLKRLDLENPEYWEEDRDE